MPCKKCGRRAHRLVRWLGFRFVAPDWVLMNPHVNLRIPGLTVHVQHLRATLLAVVARLLFPPTR